MKKPIEVDNQPLAELVGRLLAERDARISALEARIEKLDPTPKLETLQPYRVGSIVYSIVDLGATNPFTVTGYRAGRILVMGSTDDAERSLSLASVVPLERCPNAAPTPAQAFANLDPKTREFYEGRRKAEIAAKVTPPPPPPPKRSSWFGAQHEIPTYGGISVGTGDQR